MFLDCTQGSSKGQDVLKVFKKLSKTWETEVYQKEEVPRTEQNGASHLVLSYGNYSSGDSERPRLEYFCPKNI